MARYFLYFSKYLSAHDTIIKVTLHEEEAIRELLSKIIMPLLDGIKLDLDKLKLDTTSYIRPNLQVFFSDVVYQTTLIDENKDVPELVDIALLVEHKSDMPTELPLRLQLVDYINAIMKKNYNPKTDLRDQLIAYVLGQSDLTVQDLEELLNNIFSPVLKQEIMMSGTGFLAVAAREAAAVASAEARAAAEKAAEKANLQIQKANLQAEKAKRENLQDKTLTVMRSWNRGIPTDLIADIIDLPATKIMELIATFEKVKTYTLSEKQVDMKNLKKISGLNDVELKTLLSLLNQ